MTGDISMANSPKQSSPHQLQLSQEAGLIPRLLVELFHSISVHPNASDYNVKCSYMELYKEKLKDLLTLQQLQLQEPRTNVWTVPNLSIKEVKTATEALEYLKTGLKNR